MGELFSGGFPRRPCCDSYGNAWHSRPCTVNGPEGLGAELAPKDRELCPDCGSPEPFWRGPQCAGSVTHNFHRETDERMELVGIDYGYEDVQTVVVKDMRLIPYRKCCATLPGSVHWSHCATNYFAEGQTVLKPDIRWELGPGRVWPFSTGLRIKEDAVSSDRTFENETRLH